MVSCNKWIDKKDCLYLSLVIICTTQTALASVLTLEQVNRFPLSSYNLMYTHIMRNVHTLYIMLVHTRNIHTLLELLRGVKCTRQCSMLFVFSRWSSPRNKTP